MCAASLAWGQDHSIRNNQVVVDTRAHWASWAYAAGSLEISPDGELRPHLVRSNTDATRDIVEALRRFPPEGKDAQQVTVLDALETPANKPALANLFDGDETTYWEPDARRPLQDWWFQVDLGRMVNATKIVLVFVPAGQGDPFLQFTVLTSGGQPAFVSGKGLMFDRVYKTLKGNKEERRVEVELYPTELTGDRGFTGDMVRYVQVVITASDGDRGAPVTDAEYAALAPVDQGATEYYKKVTGGEVRVSRETYEIIAAPQRGSIKYFRREHPRLAELEVLTRGENLAAGILERKGIANSSDEGPMVGLIEGRFNPFINFTNRYVESEDRYVYFDLGSYYWLDTHLLFNAVIRAPIKAFRIQTSDGTVAPDGSLIWTTHASRDLSQETVRWPVYQINSFPSTKARYFRFVYPPDPQGELASGIREMLLYGHGYQPEVELTSGLIRLDEARNLVSAEWDGEAPPGTAILVQTRTGNEVADAYHYFDKGGEEVTQGGYDKLGFFQKGRIDTVQVPGADWSGWSAPYVRSGDPFASPSPRRYLMLRARLVSDDPQLAASLRSLKINFLRPLAQQLVGELEPGTVAALGTRQTFSLFIKPSFASQNLGFDEILLRSPSDMQLGFGRVRLGKETQWRTGQPEELTASQAQVMVTRPDSLWVRLDRVVRTTAVDLVEVQFATALFTPGAVLEAWLGNSAASSWQRVDPGDATALASSQDLRLLGLAADNRVIGDLAFSSTTVTPNGDGVNDQVAVSFSVRRLSGQQAVEVGIYDLDGTLVRYWLEERAAVTGLYTINWAGDDQAGRPVHPGVYLVRIRVPVDSQTKVERTVVHRLLAVAY